MSILKDFSPASFLLNTASKRAEAISLIIPNKTKYTVADSLSYTRKTASYLLDLGIKPGDRVALISANSPFHLWLHTACAWIGAVTVILNPRLATGEIDTMLVDSGAVIAFFDEKSWGRYELASSQEYLQVGSNLRNYLPLPTPKGIYAYPEITRKPLPCPSGKVGAILYTSGSSGKPKGVVLTHENLYWGSQNFRHGFHYHPHRDIEAVAAPISHIGGFNGTTLDIFTHGGTVVLFPDFNPDFILKNLEKYRVNVMFLVPTMYWLLSQSNLWHSVDLSAWRLPLIGGDSITDDLAQLLFQKGLRPVHVWGMTELSASGSCIRLKPTSPTTTTIGIPFAYNHLDLRPVAIQESYSDDCHIFHKPIPDILSDNPPMNSSAVCSGVSGKQEIHKTSIIENITGNKKAAKATTSTTRIVNTVSTINAPKTSQYTPLWGEFLVSGPSVTPGYWNLDVKLKYTPEGIWACPRTVPLDTGDVGYIDRNHCLFLIARKNRLITRGGESFFPLEVESVLRRLPDIADVVVVGVPHILWGEEICAAVVPSDSLVRKFESVFPIYDPAAVSSIFNRVLCVGEYEFLIYLFNDIAGSVARWKLPTRVIFLESLPQSMAGKVDYEQVKGLFV